MSAAAPSPGTPAPPPWLRAVLLARDPRARALVARLAATPVGASADRVLLGGRCPACGAPLALVVRGRRAPADLDAALGAAGGCLHPPAPPAPAAGPAGAGRPAAC